MEIAEELENYFKERNVQITLYPENITQKFATFRELYDFIKNEYQYWIKCDNGRTNEIRVKFNNLYDNLTQLINGFSANSNYQQQMQNIINLVAVNGFPNIYSISSYGQLIKERYIENYQQANGVIDFVQEGNFSNIGSKEYFKGVLYAFNWKNSEIALTKFEDTEESTLSELKKRYLESFNALNSEYLNKNKEIKDNYSEFLDKIGIWKDDTKKNTEDFLAEKKNKIVELEKIYEEKLKLKAPAEYWDKLREEYEITGNNWRKWAIGTSIFLIFLLTAILYKIPESLKVDVNKFKFEDLRATLILTIIISIGVYILRLFVKLSLSAYHLSRDAKERYQLTYVYLSLLNEGNVSESERNIVFQSLFSRADTGLLKGDSSPTLPDGMVQQIAKLIGK